CSEASSRTSIPIVPRIVFIIRTSTRIDRPTYSTSVPIFTTADYLDDHVESNRPTELYLLFCDYWEVERMSSHRGDRGNLSSTVDNGSSNVIDYKVGYSLSDAIH